MPLRLHDSMTREIRELTPSHSDGVFRFYNCGPTVYAPAHIGNFRTFLVNDVIRRLLELEFGADKVKHVRNLTDVDDRTIGQTQKEKLPLADITRKWTEKFHEDCTALNCRAPHAEPTATGYIREQVDMIDGLMRKGNAYRAEDGSIYFKISSFPGYGALSRIKERELKVTNTVFDADHKDDVGDFALWKAWKPDDGPVKWPGPEGAAEGRPGWHIECSAMSKAILGDTIDLHTGGVDLLFPHHENEIAQSQCCNGATLARHWYHTEHLLVDGMTMSKSKGNYYTLSDLVAKGYSPITVRYALLAGHPRKQLNFTLDSLHAADSALNRLREFQGKLGDRVPGSPTVSSNKTDWWRFEPAWDALVEDLNIPKALGVAFEVINATDLSQLSASEAQAAYLGLRQFSGSALGLPNVHPLRMSAQGASRVSISIESIPGEISALAKKRWEAKAAKDFKAADALRAELAAAGWSMLDGKDGYKLEPLKK
jgi:cysteinyl-tRNA synthetase